MWVGNVFVVRLFDCLSVQAITFEWVEHENFIYDMMVHLGNI